MSRIETLLLCILNGTTTDMEPRSRNEAILIAKINGTEYTKEPQSRIEELLLEWLAVVAEGYLMDSGGNYLVTDEDLKLYAYAR